MQKLLFFMYCPIECAFRLQIHIFRCLNGPLFCANAPNTPIGGACASDRGETAALEALELVCTNEM